MTRAHLFNQVLLGRLLFVGEYRGSHADQKEYVDKRSGDVISYIRAMHLLELTCKGKIDRAVIYERLPEIVELPEEAEFPYRKGSRMVFYLESVQSKSDQLTGFLLPGSKPEMLEDEEFMTKEEAGSEASDAPQGAPTPAPPLNLVLLPTTPQPTL